MKLAAVVFFAIAALGGLLMATLAFRRKLPPRWLPPAHAGIAIVSLLLLVWSMVQTEVTTLSLAAAIIFGLAAIVGFTLGRFHRQGGMLPLPLVVVHGALAVTAFAMVLADVLGATLGAA